MGGFLSQPRKRARAFFEDRSVLAKSGKSKLGVRSSSAQQHRQPSASSEFPFIGVHWCSFVVTLAPVENLRLPPNVRGILFNTISMNHYSSPVFNHANRRATRHSTNHPRVARCRGLRGQKIPSPSSFYTVGGDMRKMAWPTLAKVADLLQRSGVRGLPFAGRQRGSQDAR
jgi:hypothetical protein